MQGVVPWKYGFRDYIESYRSRQRRKNDEREHLRRLEERLMSHDQRQEEEVQRQVAIAMSQQQQAQTVPPEPSVAVDPRWLGDGDVCGSVGPAAISSG